MSGIETQDVALQLQDLRGKLEFMGSQQQGHINGTNQAMADVRAELRALATELKGIGTLSHDSSNHTESIRRIWTAMEKRDLLIDQAITQGRRLQNLAAGAGGVLFLLVGSLVYLYNSDRQTTKDADSAAAVRIEKLDERMDRVEIYLAGDRAQPYRR